MNNTTLSSVQVPFLSFSDLTFKSDDHTFNFLRNSWPWHPLDYLQSWSVLYLDTKYRVCGGSDLPLQQRMETEQNAHYLVSQVSLANASSFILAQNKGYGVLLPTIRERQYLKMMLEIAAEEDITLVDCFLINK